MHKTMLALVIGATVLSAPAFAQVSLGGAVQAGAHAGGTLPAGGAMHDTMRTTDQLGRRAGDSAREIGQRARHTTHRTADQAATAVRRNDHADADVNADASAHAGMAGTNGGAHAGVETGGGLDTAATAGRAGEVGQGVGGEVRDSAHSAIQSTDRRAGSVGRTVKNTAAGTAADADADANLRANGGAHGH